MLCAIHDPNHPPAILGIKIFPRSPLFRVDRRMLEFKYKIVLCQDVGDMFFAALCIF